MNSKIIISTILVLFVGYSCIPEVNGLNCYGCDSRNGTKCLGTPDGKDVVKCPTLTKSCYKVFGKLNNQDYVARGCTIVDKCVATGDIANSKFQIACEYCTSDLCNSAESLTRSKQIGIVGIVFAFMLKMLLF